MKIRCEVQETGARGPTTRKQFTRHINWIAGNPVLGPAQC